MLENLTPVENEPTLPANLPLIYIETIDLLYLLSHFLHVPNTPMGTGFNSKIIKDTSPKQKVSYLTHINFSQTNVAVVTHTMEQAQVVGKECNQTYVQVTYDLAIAKIAYKIQSTSKPQLNNLFIHLGSFHLMMAFFKAIGVFRNECGLSHMMIESNTIASGSVNGLVEGKHFNRCKRLHPLMALGLKMLHFDHFLGNIEYNFLKKQVIDDLLHYQEVIDSHSSMPIELPNNVLSAYPKFVEETRQDKDSLYNIATAKPVPENVANFLLNIEKNGEDLRKQFITECAEDQNRFDKPIKRPSA
ncbi:uncharacterized protein TNCV_975751 [Trichonephila clavipes]|nr:uncharacterized protein TNCV_975751 [Trichonephila clavipes]